MTGHVQAPAAGDGSGGRIANPPDPKGKGTPNNLPHKDRRGVLFAVVLLTSACRETVPALDPGMTSCIPASAIVVGGLNLDAIRAAAVYPKLPQAMLALTEPLREAQYAIFVFDGRDLLAISRGQFREPPAGATMLGRNLALAGPPGLVRAATSQHNAGTTGAPELVAAGDKPIWIVIRGGVTLPLGGNAANANRLLHATTHTTITIALRENIELELTAECVTADAGREFEQSLRAMLTLAAASRAGLPVVQIRREDRRVYVALTTTPDGLDQMLRALY
jgi:hypothetical protein